MGGHHSYYGCLFITFTLVKGPVHYHQPVDASFFFVVFFFKSGGGGHVSTRLNRHHNCLRCVARLRKRVLILQEGEEGKNCRCFQRDWMSLPVDRVENSCLYSSSP